MGVNYGVNKVRFPAPVPSARDPGCGHHHQRRGDRRWGPVTVTITVEIEGAAKPACVVESMSRFMLRSVRPVG